MTSRTIHDAPLTESGAGFLPLMLRALVHVVQVGRAAAAEDSQITQADLYQEVNQALDHMRRIGIQHNAALTDHARLQFTLLRDEFRDLRRGASDSPDLLRPQQREQIAATTTRAFAFAALLDEELIGVEQPNTDGGSTP